MIVSCCLREYTKAVIRKDGIARKVRNTMQQSGGLVTIIAIGQALRLWVVNRGNFSGDSEHMLPLQHAMGAWKCIVGQKSYPFEVCLSHMQTGAPRQVLVTVGSTSQPYILPAAGNGGIGTLGIPVLASQMDKIWRIRDLQANVEFSFTFLL